MVIIDEACLIQSNLSPPQGNKGSVFPCGEDPLSNVNVGTGLQATAESAGVLRLIRALLRSLFPPRGPFLERPGNLTGPKTYFEIKVSRKVGCVLTSNEVVLFL